MIQPLRARHVLVAAEQSKRLVTAEDDHADVKATASIMYFLAHPWHPCFQDTNLE